MILYLVLGALAGILAGLFYGSRQTKLAQLQTAQAQAQTAQAQARTTELEKEVARLEIEIRTTHERLTATQGEESKREEQLKMQFENLTHRLIEQSSAKLKMQSEQSLTQILAPLRERLQTFEKRVDETYQTEARERFALKGEIQRIFELNQRLSQEAQNLTRALKSDVKAQGNWGEIILERLLTESGLREGHEYTTQGRGLGLKSSDGDTQKPDVILNLPDSKHLIIDSKVSLKAFEAYSSATEELVRASSLKAFLDSVYKHIDGLSSKHYASLEGLQSPDYVFLFVPIEPAFSLMLNADPELVAYAWNKRIAFVSPTTLYATLGTIASLWKTDRQNKNALEIARQGGQLFDKFAAFVGDLEIVGRSLENSQRAYGEAFNKLRDGRGNLISRAENLRKLGAKTTKELASKLLAESSDPELPFDSEA